MVFPAHTLRVVQVRLKAGSNEGHFTLQAETAFHPCLPSHCSGVTEICHMALSAHALRGLQVRLQTVSNERHFALEAETVFRTYLP
jgi:hypothetical protein